MKWIFFTLFLTGIFFTGFYFFPEKKEVQSPKGYYGKKQAPVKVEIKKVGLKQVKITIEFITDSTDITWEIWPLGGLQISQILPDSEPGDFIYGDSVILLVEIELAPPLSGLGLEIKGKFRGIPSIKIVSFTVGSESPSSRKRKVYHRNPEGRPLHILPATQTLQ